MQDKGKKEARSAPQGGAPLPIIAIGASAGGLEAASRLFDAMPGQTGAKTGAKTGMAFIIVQHLDPTHKSLMAELLAGHTTMPVAEASDGTVLLADTVTIIPPGRYLTYRGGALYLSAPQAHHGARLPFDGLLASLADTCGPRTVAVVLSGMGGDGSHGLAALKAAGGYAIAQQPEEADYAGMPSSAVETGLVDQVLPLDAIPAALAERAAQIVAGKARGPDVAGLASIVGFLGEHTAHDFRAYKPGTIGRRIERRMALMAIGRGDYAAYLALLRNRPAERDLLARDLLINVTSFFRDTAVFDALRDRVLPDLIKTVPVARPLRIWVAGCSSGEEAYSLAMLACDALVAAGREIKLQIFASDVDPDAIAMAREGAYPLDIATSVPADLLARYFIKNEAGYRVTAALRAHVVFSVQDVLSDPPFSRMDMVSCRNLLIYLSAEAQARVTSLFRFALREGGLLLLGSAETIGKAGGRFDLIAKDERLYRHAAPSRPGEPGYPFSFGETLPRLVAPGKDTARARQASMADICARAVLGTYAPAAVLVNRAGQCLFSMGPTQRYLRLAPGYASLDLLAMAPPALRGKLRLAMDRAGPREPVVHGTPTRVQDDGAAISFRFDVRFLEGEEDLWLIAFIEEAPSSVTAPEGGDPTRIAELERELARAQEDLQIAIAAQETAHQEQKAINEEALSVNEEFQSTNEELLTSKEELQSLNEELTALNSQLQETLDRQRLTSDDLQNVLYSTNVGTLFLDKDLRIRFFTPAILALFAVIPGDVGRPLADLRAVASDPELLADAQKVVSDEVSVEREVETPRGICFLRRIFPYRARDGRVQGVVITFADISDSKAIARALEASTLEAERANIAKSRFLAAASHDLRQPLQSLILLRDLLGRVVEGARAQGLLARFDQTLGAMSGMLNTLLDINQIEAGAVQPHPVVFPVSDVFDRLRGEFATLAQARGLSLRIVPSAALVHSDPHLLEQMIRNLLGNAVKYTRRGHILLGCRRRGDDIRVEVWDTGIGIAADQLLAIFDEFHQLGTAPADSSRGLGLGLSIVQRLGILLGHAVSVRSIPDKGSVFAITLPRCQVAAPDILPRAVAAPPVSETVRHQCRIMVVDDDPDVLDLLEQLLRGQGYSAMGAPDAEAAIRLVGDGAFRPDILLTDFNLPNGTNGLDLLASLRGRLGQALPAIILSGDISTDTLARIAHADCLQLSKPADPQDLLQAIESLSQPRPKTVHPAPAPPQGAVVSVIDDDPHLRATLREVLEQAGRAVAVYDSAEAFQATYRPGGEGCVLVDVHLPGISGVDLLGALRAGGDGVPLILITGSGGIGLAVEAMRMGACDFIEKPVGRDALLASIDRAMVQARDLRIEGAAQEDATALVAGLTRRQREVMRMVLAGQPSKNIAADLGISQRTVENHRAAIMHRMGAKSLPELARRVIVADGGI